ncbi:hypothetical protein DBR11_11835 [Pedobacter sp. HMWF019]|uniref:histidine kinase dimerization/phosphoacceptor domain -containing protein n=1 Tax=Pedobacter sp. HMWF019 TaxID=2056856 RepID=UPI000D3550B3|nr:histidine kinase dimerization/phosphoacceptor domain -containing protein [Pedobacter sp. HMWF019]PTS99671.1 hypothetical protein DBR11_11835 [Pedobacter sp. HMWF019]
MLSSVYARYISLIALLCFSIVSKADTLLLSNANADHTTALKPFFKALKDQKLISLNQFHLSRPNDTFWLKATLKTSGNLDQNHFCLSFNHLTFVDLYLFENGKLKLHHKAGAFRKKNEITRGDDRFHFNLVFLPGATYQVILKIKHTKRYPPNYDFLLQSTNTYLSYNRTLELTNFWLQGAIAVLLIYSGLSWFISKYKPFIWVMLFIVSIGLYCFSLEPAFIDFFFPMHPETGWLLVLVFLHVGIVSFYLLMIEFLEMKSKAPQLYHYGHLLIKVVLVFSVLCVTHNYLTSNYFLTNQINLAFSLIHLSYIGIATVTLWRKLDASQRFLIYGILVFVTGVMVLVASAVIFGEQSLVYAPIISKVTILLITILFLTGLNQKQTELLEKKTRISTLMDELNHRVKNNLQMLYSLSALQLPLMQNEKGKQVLNDMRGRIKAMMLVNEHLSIDQQEQAISVRLLAQEIKQHIQYIYDPKEQIPIDIRISEELSFPASIALPFGLILTELFTNTFKHAFSGDHPNPSIQVEIHLRAGYFRFTYKDNGNRTENINISPSMGLSLIQDLIRQLKGNLAVNSTTGYTYLFTFPNFC